MPTIRFINDDLAVEIDSGTTLSLAAQRAESSLPFGCRAGTCGACALTVTSGEAEIEPPGFVEKDTLIECVQDGPGRRLGCQIVLGETDLEVEW